MKYEVKMSPEIKTGDQFIYKNDIYLAVSDYKQGLGAGHFDWGEYGIVSATSLTMNKAYPDTEQKISQLWLYKNLPVIVIK
jgi:hypothetical protein